MSSSQKLSTHLKSAQFTNIIHTISSSTYRHYQNFHLSLFSEKFSLFTLKQSLLQFNVNRSKSTEIINTQKEVSTALIQQLLTTREQYCGSGFFKLSMSFILTLPATLPEKHLQFIRHNCGAISANKSDALCRVHC